ncbi:MAG: hypothetical protein J2P23_01885 [Microlunatus sp.]|nr:hypothetical protein [Microlunatus sp.]
MSLLVFRTTPTQRCASVEGPVTAIDPSTSDATVAGGRWPQQRLDE